MDKYPYNVTVPTSAPGVMQRVVVDWNQLIARREFLLRDMPNDPDFNYLVLPEVERLLSSIEDGTTHLAAYTLWVTGARVSEMLMLRPEDFQLEGNMDPCVKLPILKNRTPKKNRPPRRMIGLGDGPFIETLRRYIKTQKIKRRGLLFGQLSRHAIRHRINSAGRRVQPALPLTINPHTLRHSYAINHLIHGKTPDQVRRLLGHTDMRSTDVYLRVLSADISHHGAGTPFRLPIEA